MEQDAPEELETLTWLYHLLTLRTRHEYLRNGLIMIAPAYDSAEGSSLRL